MGNIPLRRNFSWTLVGNGAYAASQLGMLVVLAKLGGAEVVGWFAFGLAVTAPIALGTALHLRTLQATDVEHRFSFGTYVRVRVLGSVAALVVTGLVVVAMDLDPPLAAVVMMVGLSKAVEGLCDVVYGRFQAAERMDVVAVSLLLRGIGGLAALSVGLWLTSSLPLAVLSLSLYWLLVFFLHDVGRVRVLNRARPDSRTLGDSDGVAALVRVSIPLGGVALLAALHPNIPRYLIQDHLGGAALGVYAGMAYMIIAGNVVIQALCQSASPRLSRALQNPDRTSFRRMLLLLLGVAVGTGAMGVLVAASVGEPLLRFLYSNEFARHNRVFIWLNVGGLVNYVATVLWFALVAARQIRHQVTLYLVLVMVSFGVAVFAVPRFGLLGGALAFLLAHVAQAAMMAGLLYLSLRRASVNREAEPPAAVALAHSGGS